MNAISSILLCSQVRLSHTCRNLEGDNIACQSRQFHMHVHSKYIMTMTITLLQIICERQAHHLAKTSLNPKHDFNGLVNTKYDIKDPRRNPGCT